MSFPQTYPWSNQVIENPGMFLEPFYRFSSFIAFLGIQHVPFEFWNKSPNPHVGKKSPKLGKYGPFLIRKQPVFRFN